MSWKSVAFRPVRRNRLANTYRPTLEQLEARQLLSTNVLTYHNDLGRTGQNLTETGLTPANVNTSSFGKLFTYQVDGQVYAQPLYVAGVTIFDGTTHDIVYVATERDIVYAFDANDPTAGANADGVLWKTDFTDRANGVTYWNTSDAYGCGQISPDLGITGTPVIDDATGIMYLVAQTKTVVGGNTTYHQILHALDITTGQDVLSPVEIQASVINDSGQTVPFNPRDYKERAGLTLSNGVVYTAWASHCDIGQAHGWVIGYDAASLSQLSVFNTSPNGTLDTIWQGDGSLAVDQDGNLYFETGNGTDISRFGDDYSEAFLRLNGGDGQTVDDYFIPFNYRALDQADRDLGSGAPIALPDQPGDHPHLLVGAGKEGKIYLIDRDNMGGLNNPPTGPDLVVQSIPNAISGGSWDTPAYFDAGDPNGPYIYYAGPNDFLKTFQLQNGLLTTIPTSQSSNRFSGNYGATPIVSANGTQNGIVWALQNTNPAILHAYDATDLSNELYNSSRVTGDQLGNGVKFNSPIVADSKVFVPGSNYLAVFGLLGTGPHGRSVPSNARIAALGTALAQGATPAAIPALPVSSSSLPTVRGDLAPVDGATSSTVGVSNDTVLSLALPTDQPSVVSAFDPVLKEAFPPADGLQ